MIQGIKNRYKLMDKYLLFAYLVMVIFSIVMVFSASSYSAMQSQGNPAYYLIRQAIHVTLSIVIMAVTASISLKKINNKKTVMAIVAVTTLLLLAVLLFGREINGAKRWIPFPIVNIQPGEIAKVVAVWYMAFILSKRETSDLSSFFGSIKKPLLIILLMATLIFFQPDTGTTVIILGTVAIMIFASGIPIKIGIGFSALGAGLLAGLMLLIRQFGDKLPLISGYRYERFQAFWDPFSLADSHGLQLVNSYYALSRGGLGGVGLGNSIQKTGYLPFPYTDFIIAIVGEELGFIGLLLVLACFFLIVLRIFLIGIHSKKAFRSLVCFGTGTLLTIQSLFNIGGVVGLLPITGLTFPFLSYGGSSLMILSFAIGLALNVSIRNNHDRQKGKVES